MARCYGAPRPGCGRGLRAVNAGSLVGYRSRVPRCGWARHGWTTWSTGAGRLTGCWCSASPAVRGSSRGAPGAWRRARRPIRARTPGGGGGDGRGARVTWASDGVPDGVEERPRARGGPPAHPPTAAGRPAGPAEGRPPRCRRRLVRGYSAGSRVGATVVVVPGQRAEDRGACAGAAAPARRCSSSNAQVGHREQRDRPTSANAGRREVVNGAARCSGPPRPDQHHRLHGRQQQPPRFRRAVAARERGSRRRRAGGGRPPRGGRAGSVSSTHRQVRVTGRRRPRTAATSPRPEPGRSRSTSSSPRRRCAAG